MDWNCLNGSLIPLSSHRLLTKLVSWDTDLASFANRLRDFVPHFTHAFVLITRVAYQPIWCVNPPRFPTKHVTQRNACFCYLTLMSSNCSCNVCILLSSPDVIPSPHLHRCTAPPRGRETEISSINSSGDLYHRTFQLCQRRGPHPPRPVSFTPISVLDKSPKPKAVRDQYSS